MCVHMSYSCAFAADPLRLVFVILTGASFSLASCGGSSMAVLDSEASNPVPNASFSASSDADPVPAVIFLFLDPSRMEPTWPRERENRS